MDIEYNKYNKPKQTDEDYLAWQLLQALNGQAKVLAIATDAAMDWVRKADRKHLDLTSNLSKALGLLSSEEKEKHGLPDTVEVR